MSFLGFELTVNLRLIGALLSIMLAGITWSGSRREQARYFSLFMLAAFVWSFFSYLGFRVPVPEDQLLYLRCQYLGVVSVPYCLFLYAQSFRYKPISLTFHLALAAIPVLTISFAFLSGQTGLFWSTRNEPNGLVLVMGPWFWVHLSFSYLLITHVFIVLIRNVGLYKGVMRKWAISILLALALSAGVNISYTSEIIKGMIHADGSSAGGIVVFPRPRPQRGPGPQAGMPGAQPPLIDFTPLAFILSGGLMAFSLRRYNVLDTMPFAKNLVFDAMRDPVLAVDPQGRVIGANRAAMELFPSKALRYGMVSIEELCPPVVTILKDGGGVNWNNQGRSYTAQVHLLNSDRQRFMGCIILFNDVTDYFDLLFELSVAREKANAANEAKGLFLASMSHEVRTPLNAVIALTELTLQTRLNPDQKDNLTTVLSAARSLLELLNDILDLSKLEAGRMSLEKMDFDLRDRLESVVRTYRLGAESKGLALELAIEDAVPRWVKGDPLKLGQILGNLLGNAVKFTASGGVVVRVAALPPGLKPKPSPDYPEESRSVGLRISVQDTGIGISPDKQGSLFESFSQADPSIRRNYGGTGLGLAICRSLTALLGGEVELVSTLGKGSTFSFVAFFEPGREPVLPEISSAARLGELSAERRKLSILVVEDSAVSAKAVMRRLEHDGHRAASADSGKMALELLAASCFDAILLDLEVPDIGGLDIARLIRSGQAVCPSGRKIPIIAMTGHSEDEALKACTDAGMDGFVTKPINFSVLLPLLDQLGRSHPAPCKGPLLDTAAPLKRLGGDEALFHEILSIFIDESETRLKDLEAARAAHDREGLRALSHKLRGAARTIGAEALASAAERLEKLMSSPGASRAEGEGDELFTRLVDLVRATCLKAKGVLPEGYVPPREE